MPYSTIIIILCCDDTEGKSFQNIIYIVKTIMCSSLIDAEYRRPVFRRKILLKA